MPHTILSIMIAWLVLLPLPGYAGPMNAPNTKKAIFAGGCFWCVEAAYDHYTDGILATTSGYTGGTTENPTYEEVAGKGTGHFEALEVEYDPEIVTYEQLLEVYWNNIDPLDDGGQFADRGSPYLTAIFYGNAEEKALAEASKAKVEARLGAPVATQILPAQPFYPAEDDHQDYHRKNPLRYQAYKYGSGRPARLKELWGDDR